MTFPVYFNVLGLHLHAHLVMESLGYCAGFQLYRTLRHRWQVKPLTFEENIWIIVGCLAGALVGSRALAFVESFQAYWPDRHDPRILLSGKTIVGGLVGGWIGVEIAKKIMHVSRKTGDVFVFPLIVGMCIGRVGCFLTGLGDDTYGTVTTLPWGVDFGDGVRRHPTQLYEILFLILLGIAIRWRMRRPYVDGQLFRMFMLAYFAWRLAVDCIKPHDPRDLWLRESPIQWVCSAGIVYILFGWVRSQSNHSPRPKAVAAGA